MIVARQPQAPARAESDPLAELARLIGQTDPFAMGRANQPVQPRSERAAVSAAGTCRRGACRRPAAMDAPRDPAGGTGAPQEDYEQDYPSAVHPLHRYATPVVAPEPEFHQAPSFAEAGQEPDPSRYDDALYGQPDPYAQQAEHDPAYADDPYAYQDGYGDDAEEPVRKKRGGMVTVAVVLALAVVGTGAAFAYRTFVGCAPQRRATDHQGRQQPDQDRAGALGRLGQGAGPHGGWRRQGKDRSARGSPGRRQCEDRSARGVSAAQSEQQSAVGRERCSGRCGARRRRQRHAAGQRHRAAPDQDPCRPRRSG